MRQLANFCKLFFCFLFLFFSFIPSAFAKEFPLIISSYNPYNLCGEYQVEGALQRFREAKSFTKIYYVQFRKVNKSDFARDAIVDWVASRENYPSSVILLDDLAFDYFHSAFKTVYFSGLNKPTSRRQKSPSDTWCGINEKIDYALLYYFLNQANFFVDTWYVLYDVNTMTTSEIIQNIKSSTSNLPIKVVYIPVRTTADLNQVYKRLYGKARLILAVVLLLYDERNSPVGMFESSVLVRKVFDKFFLVGINPLQVDLGFDMVVTVDFWGMGYTAADMYITKTCRDITASTILILNSNRLYNTELYNYYKRLQDERKNTRILER